jgi:Uma2 family endonuclease
LLEEPDEAYYIANESLVRGKPTYDSAVDPPPDLVLEVDVTNSSVPRMPTFALLGVPEVWRHDRQQLNFYRLTTAGEYVQVKYSVAFPFLTAADIQRFVNRSSQLEENALLRSFVQWAKSQQN